MQCTLNTSLVCDPVASAKFCDSGTGLNGYKEHFILAGGDGVFLKYIYKIPVE